MPVIRIVQIALLLVVIPRPAEAQQAMMERYADCVMTAFVGYELKQPWPNPEAAFSRCATEEQEIVAALSLIRNDRTQRLAYASFVRRKSDLKSEMIQMAGR